MIDGSVANEPHDSYRGEAGRAGFFSIGR